MASPPLYDQLKKFDTDIGAANSALGALRLLIEESGPCAHPKVFRGTLHTKRQLMQELDVLAAQRERLFIQKSRLIQRAVAAACSV